jgi:hypothetical protein
MLVLPTDWQVLNAASLADALVCQLRSPQLRHEFLVQLIGGALDLATVAALHRGDEPPELETLPNLVWRRGSLVYTYVPVVDDDALQACVNLVSGRSYSIVISPPGHDEVLRRALKTTPEACFAHAMPLGSFLSMRAVFASMDLGSPWHRILRELIALTNRRVIASRCSRSIRIDLPREQ